MKSVTLEIDRSFTKNYADYNYSIIREVRYLKEKNAAKYGFDIRLIAAAAQLKQRQHPERIVTRN